MRAAKITEHPNFQLMRQTDVQHIYHLQMPRWLFSDPRYADLSLDAKVVYTFLLNRFQLSRRNGWVNDAGEVFIIFPRLELARELNICEKRITAAFRCLVGLELVWEKRCGRGDANQIYLASVEPQDDPDYTSAPFLPFEEECDSRTADLAVLGDDSPSMQAQEPQDRLFKNGGFGGSRTADMAVPEPQDRRSSYIEINNTEHSHTEVSQSVLPAGADGRTDEEEELMDILDACELSFFKPDTAKVFENAIERLFYSDCFRIGNATLPQKRVRAKLHLLDDMILREAESKLHANLDEDKRITNSTAYVMSTLFNCIVESESDLMVDGYLNRLRASPGKGGMRSCT